MSRLHEYRVSIESTHQETVQFDSGISLYQDTYFDHQDKVTLTGKVTYVPPDDSLGIKPGDQVYFRYDVVGDRDKHNEQYIYHNQLFFPDGRKEWFVAPYALIGKKRGDDIQVAANMVIAQKTKVKSFESSFIVLADEYAEKVSDEILEVLYAADDSGYSKGDRVLVRSQFAQHYNLDSHYGKDVVVLKANYIIGKITD